MSPESAAAASEAKLHAHQHASRAEGTIAAVTHTVLFARRLRYRQTHVQPQLLTRGLACEDSRGRSLRGSWLPVARKTCD